MTKEIKIIIGMGIAILVMANYIFITSIPIKEDPLLKKQLEELQEDLAKFETEKAILKTERDSIVRLNTAKDFYIDSIENVLKKSRNDIWRKNKALDDLRNRNDHLNVIDSMRIARDRYN